MIVQQKPFQNGYQWLGWASLVVLLTAFGSTQAVADASGTGSQTVVHVVLVWLKEPGNLDHADRIISASHSLRDIPGVRSVKAGRVMKSKRPVVDDSYDVGLYLEFDSRDAMEAYLVHPKHQAAVKAVFRPLSARYVAYDFLHLHDEKAILPQ